MSRKRPASTLVTAKDSDDANGADAPVCSFCGHAPAAVAVHTRRRIAVPRHRSHSHNADAASTATTTKTEFYCLLHYYTTPVVHLPTEQVSMLANDNASQQQEHQPQRTAVQSLFAEAFVQLQQELSEARARSIAPSDNDPAQSEMNPNKKTHSKNKKNRSPDDPLHLLHHIHQKARVRLPKPPPSASSAVKDKSSSSRTSSGTGAGFLLPLQTPQRLQRTQQEQRRKHDALVRRMERATMADVEQQGQSAAAAASRQDLSARRRSSRQSIWNVILDQQQQQQPQDEAALGGATRKTAATSTTVTHQKSRSNKDGNGDKEGDDSNSDDLHPLAVCPVCRGNDSRVRILSTTHRAARDGVRKGEIWGSGQSRDDDTTSTRVQCLTCGRTWIERE